MLAKPVFKWVGGKRDLWYHLHAHFPKNFTNYYEPFLGGGGSFLNVLREMHKPEREFYASDINEDLIITHNVVEKYPKMLVEYLDEMYHQYRYMGITKPDGHKLYYYGLRTVLPKHPVARAARFIFILMTCYNGRYKTNVKGYINTPVGDFKIKNPFSYSNIHQTSVYLRANNVHIKRMKFTEITPSSDDFVYCDPPYQPHGSNYIDKMNYYGRHVFDFDDFIAKCNEIKDNGCHVMISNIDIPEVRDAFPGWHMHGLVVDQNISPEASTRIPRKELIITSYATNSPIQTKLFT